MLPAGALMSSHWPRSAPTLAAAGMTGGSPGPRVVSSAQPASAATAASNNEVVEVTVRIGRSPDSEWCLVCSHLLTRIRLSKPDSETLQDSGTGAPAEGRGGVCLSG